MNFKDLQKRAICMFLALLMVFTAVPVNSFATTAHTSQEGGLCAHHTAHDECGYAEAVAEQPCQHVHDDGCGYAEDTEGSCQHTHDALCGFAEAVAEQPCGYQCEDCKSEAALKNVVALFAALPEAASITADTAEAEREAIFAQLDAAMAAYDALWEEYPEQAAVFEETQLPLIQEAFALNDALTGNTAQTYDHIKYNKNSNNNVTITVKGPDGNAVPGAQITVSSGSDTYEVVEAGNGQYKFTKKNYNYNNYTITVSAAGYETKTETQWIWSSAVSITLKEVEDITQENLKTFKVFYIATGKLPNSYAGAGDSSDYGPSGNNSPLVNITVDINKLKREYSDVVQYRENTSDNHWEFTPNGAAKDMAATQAFWEAVWACMTAESQAAFVGTGFADDFYGYVLKQQKNGSSQHCDGVLTKTPPVYVIELYDQDVYFGGSVTDGGDAFKKMADVRKMFEEHLGVIISWSPSGTTGTYVSAGRIYTATITQKNAAKATQINGSEIAYESKNSSKTYYVAQFNIAITEGAAGYHTVTYTDGVGSEAIFADQVTAVESGNNVPVFTGTANREGYHFLGWRREGSSGTLTDAQIAAMTVSSNLTFHAVWEPIPTSFTGTVNVWLNDTYATDIGSLMEADTKLYVSKTSGSYIQLEKTGVGVYSAELENGTWNLYYSNDDATYVLADNGALVINNAPSSRDLDFYSVSYALEGGTVTPQIPVSYHIQGAQVAVTEAVPAKADHRFIGWKSGETIYQPETVLTGSIGNAYTLVAQWEKTVSVTVNVTIDHQGGSGFDQVDTKDDVHLELVSRATHTDAYVETGDILNLNDTSHAGFTYDPENGSGETAGIVMKTRYVSKGATFTDMPGGTTEYSVATGKTGYDTAVTATQDEDGNWIIDVQMKFNPTNFDLDFSVEVDDSVPQAYLPKAAIVKVTFWNGEQWEVITQQAGGEPGVRVNIDANGMGYGSYPVWKAASDSVIPYGYRIMVTAFVYPNGTIVPTSIVTADQAWGDNVYLATMEEVTGGQAYGSLTGAYYHAATDSQMGLLKARITMDLYDVTFNANGGTIDGQATKIVEDQYSIPSLSGYKPVRDGGYIFEGWYTKDGSVSGDWGTAAIGGTDLTEDITLYAKWKEPISVTGTVYVAGSYELSGNTHIIHDEDRTKTVMILLRKQGSSGVYGTATVDITYGADHIGAGTYTFGGLADDGTVYYIEERAANYSGLFINEPQSRTVTTDFALYSVGDNAAILDGDKIAQVNAYLPFEPASFDLKYSVDATAIASAFRPTTVEMLVTYDADHTITEPSEWPVISQMVFGTEYHGDEITLSAGKGNGSTSVWNSFPNGTSLYDYAIRVDAVTGPKLTGYGEAPYTITYQAPAHRVSGGQSKALIATMTPNQYDITYELGVDSIAVTGMSAAPKKHTWSYATDLRDAMPSRPGYAFLGWYDNATFTGEPVTRIDAAVAEEITLYAKWYQMMDDVDLSVTVIHKTPDGSGEAGNYDKNLLVQLTRAKEGTSIYADVAGHNKSYQKNVWHTLGDDADQEALFVPSVFEGLAHDYAYNLNVSLDGYYVTEKTVTPVEDLLTGATTYQVAVTLQYNPDLLDFSFDVEMAPGIDKTLWPESAEVRVTCWYDHPSEAVGLDWNTITQHESGSVTVVLDDTGRGTGSYPVWQWLDKGLNEPYYYRIEVVSLHLSDGSIVMANGTGSEHDVVYSGGDYSATVETVGCVAPSGTALTGAYGQGASGVYAQIGEVKAVISIDRWKDDPMEDSETGGDGVDDHQQALILFRSADETMGTVSGKTSQVYTLTKNGNSYSAAVTPDAVDTAAKTDAGYVFSHWTNAAGETVDPFRQQTLQGGQTYVYTANWKYNENLSYQVKYLEKGTNKALAAEKTVNNITYGTQIRAESEKIAITGYVFDYAAENSITVGMEENVLTLYYAKDKLDDAGDKETGGDGIADYKQAVIKFTSGANGNISGKTTQVITLTDVDADGNYVGNVTPEPVAISANEYYTFDKWKLPSNVEKAEENAPYAEANKLAAAGGQTYTYRVSWKPRTYSYQVRYLKKDTHTELSATVTKNLTYTGAVQTENAIAITGYHVAAGDSSVKTIAYADGQIITFYYEKNRYDLTVRFVDIETDDPIHAAMTVEDLPYQSEPDISVLKNLATIPGYTYETAVPASIIIRDESELGGNKNEITLKYRKNSYDLKVLYYYDGCLDNTKTETIPNIPYGTQISDRWSHTSNYDKSGADYVLDKITGSDDTISDNVALNEIHVYYLSDTLVDKDADTQTDGVGDGIPDIYQAVVTYAVVNGTWQGKADTTLSYVFTLYEKVSGVWRKLTPPVLDSTIPTGNVNDGFATPGSWSPVEPTAATQVHGNADYTLAYTNADTHAITVTVVNGSVSVDSISKEEKNFVLTVKDDNYSSTDVDQTVLTFTADAGHMLYSVTVDGVDASLIGNTHTFTHEKDHSIAVVFEKDVLGEDLDSDGNWDEPDGIPDKYQKRINYRIVNGTWNGIDKTDKHIYVTLKTGDAYDVNGTAALTDPYPSTKRPAAGYVANGSGWMDNAEHSISFPLTVRGLQEETFIYSYNEKQKVTITIAVEGGDSTPKPSVTEYEYTTDTTTITFTANTDHILTSATDNDVPITLVDGKYTHDYTKDREISVVYKLDRWKDAEKTPDTDTDSETGGDKTPDEQQALVKFLAGANGGVSGATTQVYTVDGSSVMLTKVTAEPENGYRLLYWRDTDGNTYTDQQLFTATRTLEGGKQYTYTAIFGKDVFHYTVEYYFDGVQDLSKKETVTGIAYETVVTLNPASRTGGENQYMLEKVEPATLKISHISADNVIKVYYVTDQWDGENNQQTGGDDIPDYRQAVVKFVSGANGTVSGKTVQVFTLEKSGNHYSGIVVPAEVTAAAATGYRFNHWEKAATEVNPYQPTMLSGGQEITYTAIFSKDVFDYTVEYYFDGVQDLSKKETVTGVAYETVVTLNPANRTGAENRYMLEKIEPATLKITHISADNVIKVYYVTDQWDGEDNKQTGGDSIPDYRQVLVTFVPGDSNGTVTGVGATQVFTLAADAASMNVTPDLTDVAATGNTGYAFDYWTKDNLLRQANPGATLKDVPGGTSIVFKAHFAKDTWKDAEKTPAVDTDSETGGDNIPDKYQATVTYVVENGTWSDGTNAERKEIFTLYNWIPADCRWIRLDVTLGDTVPKDMKPATGYTTPGYWEQKDTTEDDPVSATTVTENATYTYCYGERMKFKITVTVENGQFTPDQTVIQVVYGEDQALSFQPDTGYALDSVTVDGTEAVLADGSYTFADVTADHNIHVVYSKDSWKDSQQTPEEDTDSEEGGDGIPDYRQAVVAFAADRNGTIEGTARYVITLPEINGMYKGQFCAENTEVSAKANEGYKFAHWVLSKETLVRATPAHAADPYAPIEILGGNYYLYTAQFTEDMHDVTYPDAEKDTAPADGKPDAQTVQVQVGKFIRVDPNGGKWNGSDLVQDVKITDANKTLYDPMLDPVRDAHIFEGWKRAAGTEEDVVYVFTAQWEKDEVGKTDSDGKDIPDSIPDKYQKKVVFKVENGCWKDGTETDIALWLTLTDENGSWDENGSAELKIPTDMYAKSGYENGKWNVTPPALVTGTATETFTYRFSQIPVKEEPSDDTKAPDTGDIFANSLWIYASGMLLSAAAFVLLAYYRPEKRKTR